MKFSERLVVLAWTASLLSTAGLCADKKNPKALNSTEIAKRAAAATVGIQCVPSDSKTGAKAPTPDIPGFLVSDNGQIVTSLRSIVVCSQIAVRLPGGDVYDSVSVLDTDLRRDLVILRVKAASLPSLPLGDSSTLEIGQTLYSASFPSGNAPVGGFRQMDGYKLVQISAAPNSGEPVAGRPVLDDQGRVVGVAAAPVAGIQNQAFALPVNYVKGYLDSKNEVAFSNFALVLKAMIAAGNAAKSAAPAPGSPNIPTGVGGGIGSGTGAGVGAAPPPTNPASVGPYRIGGGVTAPSLLRRREPQYSEEARTAKLEGIVVLSLVVDEKGKPTNIKVTKPLGMGLDQKAIEAVSQWVFEPGKKDGQPVSVMATVEVNFKLL